MANLSQIKRERMKIFLETLKEVNNSDEQIKAINELENFLDEKRYGLIWEEHEEQIDIMMRDNIPVFTEDESKKIISDPQKPVNFLLEGDNLHSLYLLEKTHKGMIDMIYIDPPYNTGNKDFSYDDSFVDKEDSYKNSKWLSFMERRLIMAKKLLSRDGIIFVSIDEIEQANLELLMDEVFGPSNRIGEFIWKGRSGKGGTNTQIAFQHEYIKVYAKNKDVVNFYQIQTVSDKEKYENLRQWGDNAPFRVNRPTMFFPVLIKEDSYSLPTDDEIISLYDRETSTFDDNSLAELITKYERMGYKVILPMREDSDDGYGRWRQGVPGFKNLIASQLLTHSIDKQGVVTLKKIIPTGKESTIALDSIIDSLGTSSDGTKEIKRMFGKKVFDTTKPVQLIKYLSFLATYNKPNAIILDFFAGSGTTGESVIELNQTDNGNRKFILCTNNEAQIAENVTFPRLSMVAKGYEAKDKVKDIIYEEKLTPTRLKKMDQILSDIASLQEKIKDKYDKVSVQMNGQNLILVGERNKNSLIPARNFNLKYYKTQFIPRSVDDNYSLTDELLNHIKEMVELEFSVDLAESESVKMVLDEEELDQFFKDEQNIDLTLLIPTFVLLRGAQTYLAEQRNITIIKVPDRYFSRELKEAGEL